MEEIMQTKIDWQHHINQHKISGLNKAEYCRQNGLSKYSFYEKSRTPNSKLVELPIFPGLAGFKQVPAFEFHFQIPFSFRFRFNLAFGKDRS